MAEGWATVQVRREVKHRLERIYEKDTNRPENQKFTAYLDNILSELAEFREKVETYGAFVDFFRIKDNQIFLHDTFDKGMIIVKIKTTPKKELFCEEHNTTDCYHIGYCYNVKKVYDRLIDEGFRPPRSIK